MENDKETPKIYDKIKEKTIILKESEEQNYIINLKLYEKSISIEASNAKDTNIKYFINILYENFTKLNRFFAQFSCIEEIFELLEDMENDEFKILKNSSEFIEFYFLIEVRKKIIEIPLKLIKVESNLNSIIQNLNQKLEDLKDKEIAELKKKNENLEKKVLLLEEKLEALEQIKSDYKINLPKLIISELNKVDEFYISFQYIKDNLISLDSQIINKYDLAQINNGIKIQKNANIKKTNLIFRASRDGGSVKNYQSKCLGHKNLLILIMTQNGRKFGGFSSLKLKNFYGPQIDDTAFIFSLDSKENFYAIRGKSSIYFHKDRGPIFGDDFSATTEFIINSYGYECFDKKGGLDDTGNNRQCFDYKIGRRYLLAGKRHFGILDYEVLELEFENI